MTRDDIVFSTYEGGRRLNALKGELGVISPALAAAIDERIRGAEEMMKRIDAIVDTMEGKEREDALRQLGIHVREMEKSIVCDKTELEWPTRFLRMNFFKILRTILFPRRPNIMRAS
jgi:hypothetical protein